MWEERHIIEQSSSFWWIEFILEILKIDRFLNQKSSEMQNGHLYRIWDWQINAQYLIVKEGIKHSVKVCNYSLEMSWVNTTLARIVI